MWCLKIDSRSLILKRQGSLLLKTWLIFLLFIWLLLYQRNNNGVNSLKNVYRSLNLIREELEVLKEPMDIVLAFFKFTTINLLITMLKNIANCLKNTSRPIKFNWQGPKPLKKFMENVLIFKNFGLLMR